MEVNEPNSLGGPCLHKWSQNKIKRNTENGKKEIKSQITLELCFNKQSSYCYLPFWVTVAVCEDSLDAAVCLQK